MPPEPSALPPTPPAPPEGAGASGPVASSPAADLAGLRAVLDRLARRERLLLLARAALQVVAALALSGLLAAALVSEGVSRDPALAILLVLGSLGLLLALAWPLAPGWRAAGDLLRQARRVEVVQPELRSRLVTAVDRALLAGPPPPGTVPIPTSPVLLARAASRALALAAPVPPATVHPDRPVRLALLGALVALGLATLSGLVLPVGPLDALAALATGKVAAARLAEAQEVHDERALVGDIVLRYVFPEYTGMEPVEVVNSDGTIHAPPGTVVQIRARTARAFDAAALQVDGGDPDDALLADGRDLSGSLVVAGAGTWRFLLFTGDQVLRSADYQIIVEADAAPVVTALHAGGPAAVDAPLDLAWQADDDFGLQVVRLEIEQDGQVRQVELRRPLEAPRHLEGTATQSPRALGLKPGDKVRVRVVAQDNDLLARSPPTDPALAGDEVGKLGLSPWIELEISGPSAAGRRLTRYYQELRDALVLVLADFLVESDELPVANDPAAMQRWVEVARDRFGPTQAVYERQWGQEEPSSADGEMVRQVLDDAAVLFRFTLTTFDPNTTRRVTMGDLATFDERHDAVIESVEVAIGLLDALLQRDALNEVAQAAEAVAEEARELAEIAPDAEASELLARLDQLERLMGALARSSARLAEGQLQEFLNSRLDSAGTLMDEIRKAIAEGRLDEARAMLEQLATQLEQMSQGIQQQLAEGQQQEDQLGEAMEKTLEELAALEEQQEQLAQELSQARQEQGGDFQQQVEAWNRLDELATQAVRQAAGAVDEVADGRGWRVDSVRRLESARAEVDALRTAITARDVPEARERVEAAAWRQEQAARATLAESSRPRGAGEAIPGGVRPAGEHLRELGRTLDEIRQLLQQVEQQEEQVSPQAAQQARELSQRQQQLQDEQQRLQRQVQEVERQMPTGQGKATEAMQRAGDAMQQADDALQRGRPSPGEGHMREASEQVGAAREELERLQQQMQQMQQMQQQMGGQGDQGGREGQDGQDSPEPRSRIELPDPEQFHTPEEYRRALL
ncbi:DUF4175 domain-containing protein, partial [Myxococcota bacterium]|nr:DUF4175 domain-containing protein [Myxococcota bacterium]